MLGEDKSAPLAGIRIIEFAGLGPGPFAGMMLADMGAEVIRIDRPGTKAAPTDFLARGRRSVMLDLKQPAAVEAALALLTGADGLIEGFRPGVMERLGLGPAPCMARNPRLVYGRMTGWGQEGPLAHAAGHDLNYIALSGALWAMGEPDRAPVFPLNLLGDFGGGGMYLAFGMAAGLLKAARTGQGDVIDAAICDGTASLMAMIYGWRAGGGWQDQRGANLLDGGAPWYGVYSCADGKWVTVGALEPQFWARLLQLLEIPEAELGDRHDRGNWPVIRARLAGAFAQGPQAHWVALLEGTDACFAPVLDLEEAAQHPHNVARGVFANGGQSEPMPAPRFAGSKTPKPGAPPEPGADGQAVLAQAGMSPEEIAALLRTGALALP
ncbi:Alpha-methylacyl-CoA racemase [Candidatus Rhodobacter oscarellae]|uniref:Alpha-methylacyl-CoA racemase n=1 Tax=Candidatus Rhodobacter oscarellae TaxID=1675527 RepID=A0A0J9GYN1_9RHOB|nr:CaiB/BaiF CoA-transferase family protein [Candidatus Rhodobacter lobularis]KMW58603.1 Alpha-methylacyl-CoA racemase [Candidatus Rhodobacter lobularis]